MNLGYSGIPGVFATTAHSYLDGIRSGEPEGTSIGIDEPLLPKICLTLIWSEKPEVEVADNNIPGTPNCASLFFLKFRQLQFHNFHFFSHR